MFVCFIRSRKMASALEICFFTVLGLMSQPVGCLLIGEMLEIAEAE